MKSAGILFCLLALSCSAIAAERETSAQRWLRLVKVVREQGIAAAEKQFKGETIAFEGASGSLNSSSTMLTFPPPDHKIGCKVRLKQNVPPHSLLSIEGRIRSIKLDEDSKEAIVIVTVDAIHTTRQSTNPLR